MPRKSKIEPVPEPQIEIEPEGAQEEEETQEEIKQEVKQEVKPEVKPKRILTEKQLKNLKRAREAAVLKKRIKRTSTKS